MHKQLYGPQCHIVCPSNSACGSSSQFTVPTFRNAFRERNSGSHFEKSQETFRCNTVKMSWQHSMSGWYEMKMKKERLSA